MDNQSPSPKPRPRAWHEWDVPPLWVFAVGGLVLIGISTVIFMKIGESMSASQMPPVSAAGSAQPSADQPGEGAALGGSGATTAPDPRL